jgi:hypothetical protein
MTDRSVKALTGLPDAAGVALTLDQRLARWQAELQTGQARAARLGTARLVLFFATLIGGVMVVKTAPTFAGWLLVPTALFVLAVVLHSKARLLGARAKLATEFYAGAVARRGSDWIGQGHGGHDLVADDHTHARDLDLFGRGSLFELLCTCRTALGPRTLADWLAGTADADSARARQQAVLELAQDLDRREQLALLDPQGLGSLDGAALCSWATSGPVDIPRAHRIVGGLLAVLSVAGVIAWEVYGLGLGPLAIVGLACAAQDRLLSGRYSAVCDGARQADGGLPLLAGLLSSLEQLPAQSDALAALKQRLETPLGPPSRCIDRLRRLVGGLEDAVRNPFFMPVAFLLRFRVFRAWAIELWRRSVGSAVPRWIEAAGEYEALAALATYAHEHTDDVMPEIVEGPARLDAVAIGHPLLPASACVANDVSLDSEHSLVLISGSNMSGKSTFLRTLGTSVVLAMAGAPVRAKQLTLTPLKLGVSIQIVDSLLSGESHFYAEIRRLSTIDQLAAAEGNTLFLLDEILHGTNSSDRLAGARAVIHGLVAHGALGLVTTHDLALTAIADELGERAVNVHFEDSLVDGRMLFDYAMRPGVVSRGNALALMRSLGLDV